MKCAAFSLDGKWIATASTDGTARVWDAATYKPVPGAVIKRNAPLFCVRFSFDGSRLVAGGADSQAIVYDTATWKQDGVPVVAPGQVFSAFITPDNHYVGLSAYLLNAVQFFDIKTGGPFGQGFPIAPQSTSIDFLLKDKVIVVACDDGTVRSVDSPFVDQDTPPWICDFAERLAGRKTTGDGTFEAVDSSYKDLTAFITPEVKAANTDFPRVATWRLETGEQRSGMPRFTSTLADNILQRVLQRSLPDLFECYNALPGDPFVLASLSLYWPNKQHGEFLADLVVSMPDAPPLARCFAAHELALSGRGDEAERVIQKAIADAPGEYRVLRRSAKVEAALQHKERAIELFDKAVTIEPNSSENHRSYGWALYHFGEPAKAAEQFRIAEDLMGDMNEDLVAGLTVCAAAQKQAAEAKADFARLVAINPDWKKASYIAGLRGWTDQELTELEHLRSTLYHNK